MSVTQFPPHRLQLRAQPIQAYNRVSQHDSGDACDAGTVSVTTVCLLKDDDGATWRIRVSSDLRGPKNPEGIAVYRQDTGGAFAQNDSVDFVRLIYSYKNQSVLRAQVKRPADFESIIRHANALAMKNGLLKCEKAVWSGMDCRRPPRPKGRGICPGTFRWKYQDCPDMG